MAHARLNLTRTRVRALEPCKLRASGADICKLHELDQTLLGGTQVLSSVASKAFGATNVAPNLMSMALDALNDTARGSLHTEDEQLTLGRVRLTSRTSFYVVFWEFYEILGNR